MNEEASGRKGSHRMRQSTGKKGVICFPRLSSKELESYKELSLSPGPPNFLWKQREAVVTEAPVAAS